MDKVSIIIPCRNEETHITHCLNSFLKMQNESLMIEILAIDGLSSDATLKILNYYSSKNRNIKILHNHNKTTPYAINLGIVNASYEYVMIASAHSTFNQNYLNILLSNIKLYNVAGIGGLVITDVHNVNPKSSAIKKVLANRFGVGNSIFRVGAVKPTYVDIIPFGLYKKDIFKEIGLYNILLTRNQDMELAKRLLRMGKRLLLIPDAKCIYFARETFTSLFKNNFGNGLWIFPTVMITKTFSSLSLRHFIPIIFILSLVFPLFFIPISSYFIFVPLISLFSYLALIIIISLRLKDKTTTFANIVKAFMILHFSYGFGSLVGLFRLDYLFKKNEIKYL